MFGFTYDRCDNIYSEDFKFLHLCPLNHERNYISTSNDFLFHYQTNPSKKSRIKNFGNK